MIPRMCNSLMTLILINTVTAVTGAEQGNADDIKQLRGISIVGDKEAPRSLYIVPWQNAELTQSTSLSTRLVDNNMQALDRESFRRQLRLRELSKSGWYRITEDRP